MTTWQQEMELTQEQWEQRDNAEVEIEENFDLRINGEVIKDYFKTA